MPPKGWKKQPAGDTDPDGLAAWTRRHVEHLRVKGYSEAGLRSRESRLSLFVEWAHHRSITKPTEVSKPILEKYASHCFYLRLKSGKPLTFSAQRSRLESVKMFFRWLTKENVLLANPASEMELPRVPRALPRAIFSEPEAERVLGVPDTTELIGLRDRTMMEVLYSTGVRRFELCNLEVFDVDFDRGTMLVRLGKGRRDRTVPIGERALHWVRRYMDDVRPHLVVGRDDGRLFLSETGERIDEPHLTYVFGKYIIESGVSKRGAVHIWRHTMATLMLEGGADVRIIQSVLGHAVLSTTEVYTHVSIKHAKAVHDATHPAAKLKPTRRQLAVEPQPAPAELEAVLEAEAEEESA